MRVYDFPRKDTLRSKRKLKRKIRHIVRILNKRMREDVFKDRFWIEIVQSDIRPWDDNSGWDADFRIAFHDNENPARDFTRWYEPHFIIYSGMFAGGNHVDSDLNDFIVHSDFWSKYRNGTNQ